MKPGQRLMMWLLPHVVEERPQEGVLHRLCNTNILLFYDPADGDNGEFVDLVSITAVRQGQGDGTQALRLLTGMADLFGVKLALYARAMDHKPWSTNRVVRWYERHGFECCSEWKPIDADPDEIDEDHHGIDMWRPLDPHRTASLDNTHAQDLARPQRLSTHQALTAAPAGE